MQADKTIWLGQYPRLLLILSARLLPHVSARRGFTGRIEVAAELRARRQLLFRPRLEPGDPVVPPAAGLFIGAGQPGRRVVAPIGRRPIASLVLRRRIDHTGDVSACAEDKA